jgi:hypothetical protein
VIPVQFVLFTLSAIIGSAILYGDFQKAKFHEIVTFLYGCAATFVGVFTIAWTPVDPRILGTEDNVGGSEETGTSPNASQAIHDGTPFGLGTIGRRKRGALVMPSGATGPKDTPSLRHKRGGLGVMGISPAQVRFLLQFWLPLVFVVHQLSFSICCSSTLLPGRFLGEAGMGMPMSRGLFRQNSREGAEQ